jgi:Cu-Zn family superoxide dismutase
MVHRTRPVPVSSALPVLGLCAALLSGCDAGAAGDEGAATGSQAAMPRAEHAVAVLSPVGDSGVSGVVEFHAEDGAIRITGQIENLSAGEHGFHIHQYGDLTAGADGSSAGGHFAPENAPHGAPDAEQRHVGDLGNITADDSGVAEIDKTDSVVALSGAHSILGRAVVVHADPDSFSGKSGEAGSRVAFGVVGRAED